MGARIMIVPIWGLFYVVMANGYPPNLEMMHYKEALSKKHCVQMAAEEWKKYYAIDTFNRNLFTYCSDYPNRSKRFFNIICDRQGVCTGELK
jgi:hypothetical protein